MVVLSTHWSLSRLESNNKSCFVFIKGAQLTLQLNWEWANPLLLLCLSPSLMLSTYTETQWNTLRLVSVLKSHSQRCWKSLTEVKVNESGGRLGSGRASDEPKSGAAWHGVNHELTRWEEDSRGQSSDYVKTSDLNIWQLSMQSVFAHMLLKSKFLGNNVLGLLWSGPD